MRNVQRIAVCFCILMTALLTVLAIPGVAEEIYVPTEPFTWDYLATIGGCAVVVLIVVQLTKNLLDKLVKIPTAIYAYVLAVIVMLLATAFTTGLTPANGLLTLFNGWIVACTASRTYDAIAGKSAAEDNE